MRFKTLRHKRLCVAVDVAVKRGGAEMEMLLRCGAMNSGTLSTRRFADYSARPYSALQMQQQVARVSDDVSDTSLFLPSSVSLTRLPVDEIVLAERRERTKQKNEKF